MQKTRASSPSMAEPSSPAALEKTKIVAPVPVSPISVASCGISSNELSPAVLQNGEPSGNSDDAWLTEMRYRVLVAYQFSAWEKAKLSELFESVIKMELKRQTELHEILLAFVPRQRRLFSGATSSQTQVLDELKPRTTDEIKEDIESQVEKHADVLQHGRSRDRLLSKPPSMTRGKDSFEMNLESIFTPLSSNLVCSSTILERKKGWAGWKRVLVVVTADYFLHLFDLPASAKTAQSPEEAFFDLVPNLDFPTSEGGIPRAKSRNHLKRVNPAESFFLPKCTLAPIPNHGENIKIVGNVVGRFGQSKTRKILLRTGSANETSEWIGSLQKESSRGVEKWYNVELV